MVGQNNNCVIVHGCPSDETEEPTKEYAKHWMPWVKQELDKRGISTSLPIMPEAWQPDYDKFKTEFEKLTVDESTVLIGHSCGSAFLVRWLGETKRKVKKLILVAPWKIPTEGDPYREKFYVYPIDKTIQGRVEDIIMFTADNEEIDGKRALQIYQESLGGRTIELKGHGHFTMNDMGTEEFPELLEEVLR
jgi:predicted alpha/beta hydrolase family esterase